MKQCNIRKSKYALADILAEIAGLADSKGNEELIRKLADKAFEIETSRLRKED